MAISDETVRLFAALVRLEAPTCAVVVWSGSPAPLSRGPIMSDIATLSDRSAPRRTGEVAIPDAEAASGQ
ncbi:hypothetical protein ASD65_05885 [Microbacterium sp. Root61]|nr:hypothetical protein ASD65_05885 [Microbacterium sp. Root61]